MTATITVKWFKKSKSINICQPFDGKVEIRTSTKSAAHIKQSDGSVKTKGRGCFSKRITCQD